MLSKKIGWLAGLLGALAVAGAAEAQQRIGGTGGTGGTGGVTGGASGGFTGSSSGGFTGGTGSQGGFSGQSQGGQTQSGLGSRTGTGTTTYGQTSFMGRYYGNPLAVGVSTARTGQTSQGQGGGGGGSSTQSSTQIQPQYPFQLRFGQPVYDQATVSRTGQLGTTAGTGTQGGLGTSSSLGTSRATGGSSVGIRRAPQYLTQLSPTIDESAPARGTTTGVQATNLGDLRAVIQGSTRLPSRDNISVSSGSNGVVVLRGQVGSERERRMAEALLRLSPGVRDVRNELTRP